MVKTIFFLAARWEWLQSHPVGNADVSDSKIPMKNTPGASGSTACKTIPTKSTDETHVGFSINGGSSIAGW